MTTASMESMSSEDGSGPEANGRDVEISADSGWTVRPSDLSGEAHDPLLGCLVALTRYHGRPYSANALRHGLPLRDNRLTPELFVRAAARAGLTARIAARRLDGVPDMVLPAVLLLDDGDACVLVRREGKGADRRAVLMTAETGGGMAEMPLADLEARYAGYAIFAKPDFAFEHRVERMLRSEAGSWFWGTLRHFWPTYGQVVLAAILINSFALASPLFVMNVYDRVVPNQALETLWVLAIGICVVVAFDFILKTLRAYFVDNAGKRADVLLSSRIFEHVLNLKMQARPDSSGAFANRLREFESLREFFSSAALVALVDLPFVFLFVGVIWLIGGPVAVVPAVAVPAVIVVGLFLHIPMRRATARDSDEKAHKHGIILETIGALDTVKALGAESRMQEAWERFVGRAAKTSLGLRTASGAGIHLSQAVMQLVTVGVVILGVRQIIAGQLTVGGLIACTIIAGRAMAPLGQVAGLLARLNQSMEALKGLDQIMRLPTERAAGKRFLNRPEIKGYVEFQNVTFGYPGSEIASVRDVSVRIDAGERIGVIGPVGSGKTTLARLLCGLYEPVDGAVLLDATDVRQVDPADVRNAIGQVMQDVVLFQGSIRDNIAIGQPHADDAMILEAARLAGVHDFVSRHPMGYDWMVGERGQLLSGGQRQCIGLARALLRDPSILLLDEPTSMMDMKSEQRFMERLHGILPGKTLILITHRPTLLQLVDRVLVMGDGRLVRDGPRDDILGLGRQRAKPRQTGVRVTPGRARDGA